MSEVSKFEQLRKRLGTRGKHEGGPVFMGRPDRWWERFTVRCAKDHVSTCVLKTARGDACLACLSPVTLTFPEDKDGPLLR
jgi:hypothetical protein